MRVPEILLVPLVWKKKKIITLVGQAKRVYQVNGDIGEYGDLFGLNLTPHSSEDVGGSGLIFF